MLLLGHLDNQFLLFCNIILLSAHLSFLKNLAGQDTILQIPFLIKNLYNGIYIIRLDNAILQSYSRIQSYLHKAIPIPIIQICITQLHNKII